jgi:hypothetical protein
MRKTSIAVAAGLGLSLLLGAAAPQGCGSGSSTSSQAAASGQLAGSGTGSSSLSLRAELRGFREVPAISTTGTGAFRAEVAADGQSLSWELTYSDLEGNAGGAVTGAHLHLGQRGVPGGIAIHLCGGGGGTGPCPDPPATLTGTVGPDGVVGPSAQGLDPGELAELLRAARAGVTYVNVHTTRFPTGEIRGQVRAVAHREGDREHDLDDD